MQGGWLALRVPPEHPQRSLLQSSMFVSNKIKTHLPVIPAHLILKALKMCTSWTQLSY